MLQLSDYRIEVVALPALEFDQAVLFVDPKPGGGPVVVSATRARPVILAFWAFTEVVPRDDLV